MGYKTCSIDLYVAPDLREDKNFRLESIEDYLSNLTKISYSAVQIPSILSLEFDINLSLSYPLNYNTFPYKYCKITVGSNYYYCFITNHKISSNNSVRISLLVDTINSFWSCFTWSNNTIVSRKHKDRFVQKSISHLAAFDLYRIVDNVDEGLKPYLKRDSKTTLQDNNSNIDWYLVYKTEEQLTEENLENPLHCFCVPSIDMLSPISATTVTWDLSQMSASRYYYFLKEENPNFYATFAGTICDWTTGTNTSGIIFRFYKIGSTIYLERADYSSTGTVWTLVTQVTSGNFVITNCQVYHASATNTIDTLEISKLTATTINVGVNYIDGIKKVDRTDARIMKIIGLPYAPDDVFSYNSTSGVLTYDDDIWEYTGNALRLKNDALYTDFENTNVSFTYDVMKITQSDFLISQMLAMTKNQAYESKLYNSAFYQDKCVYDSFAWQVALERMAKNLTAIPECDITFKPSNQIQSKYIFKFDITNYTELEDYEQFMSVTRNNELALLNSDYLNYMRVGYNFDKKNKERQVATSAISTGLQVAGAVASFASSSVTGAAGLVAGISLASSAIASATNLVNTIQATEQSLSEKLAQLQAQSGSITSSDDINLLKFYNGNKLQRIVYSCTDEMKSALFNLFYLTGYATNKAEAPTWQTRCWFDFIQCTPAFSDVNYATGLTQELYDNFVARFQNGVTIYHKFNNTWNLDQTLENWETWIVS